MSLFGAGGPTKESLIIYLLSQYCFWGLDSEHQAWCMCAYPLNHLTFLLIFEFDVPLNEL